MKLCVVAFVALCLAAAAADKAVVNQKNNQKWPFEGLLKRVNQTFSGASEEVEGQIAFAAQKKTKSLRNSKPEETEEDDGDVRLPFQNMKQFGDVESAEDLTNSSISETNGMVDQLEKAQIAEEKRAVFRSLTRLRGVAISSFDGIASAHTANIDRYSKTHKWNKEHPLKHLASEESDVKAWAFPQKADFL
eukprot:TRINITY_DN93299_c0_g1_i1.p1 TRINITY_DN93299_c0_g1~~TRINITY_DN93299_c0_g1_i1.p1  ORF type:complete len:191 (-),score=48.62 TRINITY_DN93299_c0_g1_i1:26-598(-)